MVHDSPQVSSLFFGSKRGNNNAEGFWCFWWLIDSIFFGGVPIKHVHCLSIISFKFQPCTTAYCCWWVKYSFWKLFDLIAPSAETVSPWEQLLQSEGWSVPALAKKGPSPIFFPWFWWTLRLSCWIAAGFCRRRQWSFTELISAGRQMLAKSHFAAKGKLSFGNLTWLWKMVHFVRWFTFIY